VIVYAAADLHGNLPDVPEDADVLLLAGDLCPDFRPFGNRGGRLVDETGTRQRDWMLNEFNQWADRALKGGVKEIAYTWGNHDFVGEKSWLVKDIMRYVPATLLVDRTAMIQGLRVFGTPWVPGLPYWAFYGRDEALKARADLVPEDLDVLMSHGPPYGHGDYIPGGSEKQVSKYGNLTGLNVGDTALELAIRAKRPQVTICGHIHEDRGQHDLDGNSVINCAAVDENYVLHEKPWMRLYELDA
jgi:Icc-related predicted phosphoesterase